MNRTFVAGRHRHAVGELVAAHVGHDDVGQQQIDAAGELAADFLRRTDGRSASSTR